MLFSQSELNLAALRTVKLLPAHISWLFRKTCTTLRSSGLVSACQRTHAVRRPSPWATRGSASQPSCQRPSAQSRHTEFTTQRFGRALKIGKDQGSEVSVDVLVTSSKQQAGIPGPLFIPDESAWPMSTLLINGDDFDRVRPMNPAPSAPRLSPS